MSRSKRPKSRKRPKRYHRGRGEAGSWRATGADLPETGAVPDALGEPIPHSHGGGAKNHRESRRAMKEARG